MQIEALRICNLSISRCSALALAFQGEGWNNQAALIQCPKMSTDVAGVAVPRFHTRCRRLRSPPDLHLPSHRGAC